MIPLGILESVPFGNPDEWVLRGVLGKGLEICNPLEMFGFVGFGSLDLSFLLLKENPKDICFS